MSYYPIQPCIESPYPQPWVHEKEVLPDARLRPYVVCYWTTYATRPVQEPCLIHGVPDGCIDLLLHCHNFTGSYLIGIAAKPILQPLSGKIRYFGARFFPGGLARFFPFPPDYAYDAGMPLSNLAGCAFRPYEEQIVAADSFQEQVALMEAFLLQRLSRQTIPRIDARVLRLLDQIYRRNGQITVEQLARDERMSARHLQRLFRSALGLNPKTLSRVIRFQHSLRHITQQPNAKLGDLALDLGYFDQAHFLNDFKQMYGKTPSALLQVKFSPDEQRISA